MNWRTLQRRWDQTKGRLRQQWGELTDDDVERIAGKRDELIGRLEERYGMAKESADRAVKMWIETVKGA